MKVIPMERVKEKFCNLKCGDVFRFCGSYYIKVEEVRRVEDDETVCNAVFLPTGELCGFGLNEPIQIAHGAFMEVYDND